MLPFWWKKWKENRKNKDQDGCHKCQTKSWLYFDLKHFTFYCGYDLAAEGSRIVCNMEHVYCILMTEFRDIFLSIQNPEEDRLCWVLLLEASTQRLKKCIWNNYFDDWHFRDIFLSVQPENTLLPFKSI